MVHQFHVRAEEGPDILRQCNTSVTAPPAHQRLCIAALVVVCDCKVLMKAFSWLCLGPLTERPLASSNTADDVQSSSVFDRVLRG